MNTNCYRNLGLDIARTIAISLVLAIHLCTNIFTNEIWVLWYLAYLGVDIFFVLSGFLIGEILLKSINPVSGKLEYSSLLRFYIRRWLRTVPLYLIFLILNFFIELFIFRRVEYFDIRYLFWLQNFVQTPPSFFGESWSLSVEEWFYIIFPLGMYFSLRLKNIKINCNVMLVYTFLYITAINISRWYKYDFNLNEFNIVLYRLDSIAYGVLFSFLNKAYLNEIFKKFKLVIGLAGLALLIFSIFIFLKKTLFVQTYIYYYPLSGIGLSLCLVYMKEINTSRSYPNLSLIFSYISKVSYSIYLNNLLIIYLTLRYVKCSQWLQLLVAVVLILTFSVFTYKLIERRIFDLRNKYFPAINYYYLDHSYQRTKSQE